MRHRAFTLVELLVVIGIIAVLLGILLPTIAGSRRSAVRVQCASNLRQQVMTMHVYANEHRGFLPRYDPFLLPPAATSTDTGANSIDLANAWYDAMLTRYKQPHDLLFCPDATDELKSRKYNLFSYIIAGYSHWVPRRDADLMYPPAETVGAYLVNGSDPIQGPVRLGDRLAKTNPVLSDSVLVIKERVVDPTSYNLATAPQSDFQIDLSHHLHRGRLTGANLAWIDGHVEWRPPRELKLRYLSQNSWNCW
ncbi:MAG TPA: type II secretion system protein [Tepidisphaeraceae bacterium]|jgi:prepilin-type N-terminal cleavage/methylation domain-containing protein/prepilin-type processing-associated H-X9-DG protein|nr:type II secretion system protein [Tepidisphaeraceae bacterium]